MASLSHSRGILSPEKRFRSGTALVLAVFLATSPAAPAFGSVSAEPPAAAVKSAAPAAATADPGNAPGADGLAARLQAMAKALASLESDLEAPAESSPPVQAVDGRLGALRSELATIDRGMMDDLAAVEARLHEAALPQAILDRQSEGRAAIRTKLDRLDALLAEALGTTAVDTKRAAVSAALTWLEENLGGTPRRPFDPTDIPSRAVADPSTTGPRTTPWQADPENVDPVAPELLGRVATKALDLGELPGASDPALLAETDEVRLSPRVQAKAAELGGDPLRIYDWVRNNVAWTPTWGAKQSSDLTLGSLRGNAFDSASLTIALLRASGVPARYVHGTIDVPADRFLSWVGGFESIDAAWDFVGSGGVPIVGVTSGGRVTKMRMEHVWVEAALDFEPSKGAVNRVADTWVPMDPTFGQSAQHTTPDYVATSGVDALAVYDAYLSSGTRNDAERWIQSLDPNVLTSGFGLDAATGQTVADSVRSFANGVFDPTDHPTLSQVLDGERPLEEERPVASLSLPYQPLAIGARYAALPSSLQAKATFGFGTDILGDLLNPVTVPLTRVNNERMTLSFTFASPADHDTLAAFLPDPAAVTGLSDLPRSIPAYLITVVPQLRVGEEVVGSGTPIRLGETLTFAFRMELPGVGRTKVYSADVPAGSHLAVGVVADSVDPGRFAEISRRFAEAKALLLTGTVDDILAYAPNFTNRLSGDVFWGGMLEFFGKQLAVGDLLGLGGGNGRATLLSGIGTFGYRPQTRFFFGLPRSIELGTVTMDVPHLLYAAEASNDDPAARRLLALQLGLYGSSLEGDVPANLFTFDQATPAEGASAANNIRRALREGQRIYHIDSSNRSAISQVHFDADAVAEITAAVDAGLEVVTHTDLLPLPGSAAGQSTSGYVITDPVTGFGLYRLGTGANGGVSNIADEMLQDCAYTNRPEFIDNNNDWARHQITQKCADIARMLKEEAAETQAEQFENKFDTVKNFHEVYAKVPMVIVDCMMAGAPLELGDALILIRSASIQLAFQAAQMQVTTLVDFLKDMSEKLLEFVNKVHSICLGEEP